MFATLCEGRVINTMLFVQMPDGSQFICDLMPCSLGRFANDVEDAKDMDYRKIMPLTYEELMQWAYIAANRNAMDLSRQYSLFHFPMVGETHLITVSVHGIGVLGEHTFPPVGNWDGTVVNACCATISISLLPGLLPEQFAMLRSAMGNIRKLVHCSTATGGPENMDELLGPMVSMYFCHRAFTRVLGMEYKLPLILTIADDPNKTTAAIADCWLCDLISVLFTFDIATVRRKDGPLATVVHLCPEQIVQLCPAAEVNNVLTTLNASLLPQFEGMQLLDSVMVIDPDEIDYDVFDKFGPSYGDEPSTSTASASTSGVQDVEDVV